MKAPNTSQWIAEVVAGYQCGTPAYAPIIADIDDTLLDSHQRWYELYLSLLAQKNPSQPPLSKTGFIKVGYRQAMAPLIADYDGLKARLIRDEVFHADFPLVGHSDSVQFAARHGIPHGFLSMRPPQLHDVTMRNLMRHGIAKAPALLLGTDSNFTDTISRKTAILSRLRTAFDAQGFGDRPIYYVDDYEAMAQSLNTQLHGVVGIHRAQNFSWDTLLATACLSAGGGSDIMG